MPGRERVHQDAALSNLAVQYSQQGNFIADMVLPPLKVAKESDKYYTFALKDVISRKHQTLRADGAESNEADFDVSTSTYQCEEYALNDIVTDRAKKNADAPIELEMDTTKWLTEQILLDREMRVAAAVFNGTTFTSNGTTLSGNNQWSAQDTSDPLADVETGKEGIIKSALKMPNTMIVGYEVFKQLKFHPVIMDKVKYGGGPDNPAIIGPPELAKAFGVEKFLVGMSVYNANNIGQTASASFIWGKYAMIAYIASTPPRKGVTLGATMRAQEFQVSKWYEQKRKGVIIEPSIVDDEVIVCVGAGYLIQAAVA